MGTFSHFQVQKSFYQALTGDATLMGMITGVYDRVTEATAFPYLTIGEGVGRDWSTRTTSGLELLVPVHVFSRSGGRKQAEEIMERIHTVLHQASPAVTGHTLVLLRFGSSEMLLEEDGLTYHGVMRFRVLTEASG